MSRAIPRQQSGSGVSPHGDDDDVIFAAPGTRGFYDLPRVGCADFGGAIKAEELTPRIFRLDYAIRMRVTRDSGETVILISSYWTRAGLEVGGLPQA